ncbi:copper-binding protein [Billgrantia montanilacus]|uniref:Cation transporter n=1 Tax=Billgrantia montanilacus TaxID=2282305 RepID=A0A368U3R0_9GAMM|nr:copper-binding protein [Halomonas montanilacus]RCV89663.1 cation transporter [Halomonas montanilacus]
MKHIVLQMAVVASFLITGPAVASSDHGHANHANHGATDRHPEMRTAEGVGTVQSIAEDGSSVVLAHEPITELRWPAMTMEMALADPALAELVKTDDYVAFVLRQTGETDYEIISIQAAPSQ